MTLRDRLQGAFGRADPHHYRWQTEHPYVAARERELVHAAFLPLGERVLDLGCGEGATLRHLDAPAGAVGVDLFEDKVRFAGKELPGCRFVAASAEALPFENHSFDQVIVRDLVHHLDEPHRTLDEVWRVLAPGGRVDVLEPCRYNPLIALHAALLPAERGELRSTPGYLEGLLAPRFTLERRRHHQPLPLHRVLMHPSYGLPATLARDEAVHRLVDAVERAAEALVPRLGWAYIHVRATKR